LAAVIDYFSFAQCRAQNRANRIPMQLNVLFGHHQDVNWRKNAMQFAVDLLSQEAPLRFKTQIIRTRLDARRVL